YWAEAMANATHTWNRIVTNSTNVTPLERWKGKRPDDDFLEHLRPFGCRVYTYNYRRNSKLGDRAVAAVFLGYELSTKNYRILLDDGKVTKIDAHNVRFIEDDFPRNQIVPPKLNSKNVEPKQVKKKRSGYSNFVRYDSDSESENDEAKQDEDRQQ